MKRHAQCNEQLEQARQEHRCAIAPSPEIGRAFRRRVQLGEMLSPYRGIFVEPEYWNSLNATQQALHTARALAMIRPNLVFAGPTAAAILRYEHQRTIHGRHVYIASTKHSDPDPPTGRLARIYMPSIPSIHVGHMWLTAPRRTLVDCAKMLPLHKALPIYDSAIAQDETLPDQVRETARSLRPRSASVEMALRHTDTASDNGGESFVRGVMIECGFVPPICQYVIHDPTNPNAWYRADFIWFAPDGRVIVVEFDGMAKYTDPSMTGGHSVRYVVNEQRIREKNLLSWGVTNIVRVYFEDAANREPLIAKLRAAGVPEYPATMVPTL